MATPRSPLARVFGSFVGWLAGAGWTGAVTVVAAVLTEASPVQLVLLAASSLAFFFGIIGVYGELHPPPPDTDLRDRRSEKIRGWREAVERWRRNYPHFDPGGREFFHDTAHCTEIMAHMTPEEKDTWEAEGGRRQIDLMQKVLARLQSEWDLV